LVTGEGYQVIVVISKQGVYILTAVVVPVVVVPAVAVAAAMLLINVKGMSVISYGWDG
jgi:hypothetical protein